MNNKNNQNGSGQIKVRFSIGAKLVLIISFFVILSLGSITALVSWLVRTDLQVSAEEKNYETNRLAAMDAEKTIENVRAHSRVLIKSLISSGRNTSETADHIFAENPQIASVFFIAPNRQEIVLNNKGFYSNHEIEEELAFSYFNNQRDALGRTVRGETLLLNASPHFSFPMLALFFPLSAETGLSAGVGGVLFSSEEINENFGFGTNLSYMINQDGDIITHADYSFVRTMVNIYHKEFIRSIIESPDKNRQQLIETNFNFANSEEAPSHLITRQFTAFTKLNTAGAIVITNIEYNKVFEGIEATTRRNIYLTIAVLSLSIIFIWFFSKTISVPLKALTIVAHNIEEGSFDMNLKPKGRDEISVLTNSFQKMCAALHVFGRFTNKEIAVKAMKGEIKPGGLPKHATIFFSDIRGFTAKSEDFTKHFGKDASDKIIFWLNNYFTRMVECVEKTNGVVDKFIGDAVMAHWGTAYTSGSPAQDAFNCVKAAIMMRNALYAMNKQRAKDDPANPPIQIGCGINTGLVTAGQLGSDMRMEYTVIGDPVNLASRIEALTKPLGTDILISEDTWKLVGSKFITEEMPSVTVKGKEKPVRIFAVINLAGINKGPQSLSDVRKLLGIEAPEISNIDVNAEEKKYKIGEAK